MNPRFSIRQFIRLLLIVGGSILITVYFPTVVFDQAATLTDPTFGLIVFVFIAGFLISQAMGRARDLDRSVSYELSRLRRVVHLTEEIDATAAWKKDIRNTVVAYLRSVAGEKFIYYDDAHETFREITHKLYAYKPKTRRSEILFAEILAVTRDLSLHRQRVAQQIQASVSPHTWTVLVILILINIVLLLGSREPGFTSPLFITGAISGLLLVLDVLYEVDTLTKSDQQQYQMRYAANARDMRLGSKNEYAKKERKS